MHTTVQDSDNGPFLPINSESDLKFHSQCNLLCKYAHDTTITVTQNTDISAEEIFHRRGLRGF
jgi:hypothetical protein